MNEGRGLPRSGEGLQAERGVRPQLQMRAGGFHQMLVHELLGGSPTWHKMIGRLLFEYKQPDRS